MNRNWQRALIVSALVAASAAGGCSESTEVVPLPTGPIRLDIRNGTWAVNETASFIGDDSCLTRPDTTFSGTDTLCTVNIGSAHQDVPAHYWYRNGRAAHELRRSAGGP